MSRYLCCILLGILLPVVALAQTGKAVLLDWKFKEGEKFWVDTLTRVEQVEKMGTQQGANIVVMRTITSYLVKKVTESNYVELEAKIESTRYENNQTPDSQKMSTLFGMLQGATFKLTMNPERQVQKLEGYSDWLLKLAGQIQPSEVDRLRALVPEADIRNAASEGFGFLPGKEITLNQQWKKKCELNLAPAGLLNYQVNYTYRGNDKGKEKIVIDCKENGKYTMTPGMSAAGTQSEFTLVSRTGTIWFNNQTGKLDQAEHVYQTQGNILMPATATSAAATLQVTNRIQVKQTLSMRPPAK
ncbi:MAG TPA: DUF6263 family protein [Gemmatales bacterium]|nr:DUF6263 family protein [Gemmatales bacterium]